MVKSRTSPTHRRTTGSLFLNRRHNQPHFFGISPSIGIQTVSNGRIGKAQESIFAPETNVAIGETKITFVQRTAVSRQVDWPFYGHK